MPQTLESNNILSNRSTLSKINLKDSSQDKDLTVYIFKYVLPLVYYYIQPPLLTLRWKPHPIVYPLLPLLFAAYVTWLKFLHWNYRSRRM